MRFGRLGLWLEVVFVVAVVALLCDRATGDETGPPYHDPLINQIAFGLFIGATLVFVALCVVALVRLIRARSSAQDS